MNRNNGNFLVDVATGEVYKDAVIYDNGYATVYDGKQNDVYLLAAIHWFTDVYYGYRDSPYYTYSSKKEFVKVSSPVYVPTNENKE